MSTNKLGTLGLYKSPVRMSDFLIDNFLEGVDDGGQEISYRDDMTPVKNQGRKGACVGFAYVGVKEYQEFEETGKVLDLSEQYLYERARVESGHSEGTTMKAGATILREMGVPLEKYWRYTDNKENIGRPKDGANKNAKVYRVNKTIYTRIRSHTQLRAALLEFGPIGIGVKVYSNWYRQKKGHIPTASICERAKGVLGGHAICLVGHSPENKEYCFKNSWSELWGDAGYGYITETDMKRTFMDGFALVDIENEEIPYVARVMGLPEKEQMRLFA